MKTLLKILILFVSLVSFGQTREQQKDVIEINGELFQWIKRSSTAATVNTPQVGDYVVNGYVNDSLVTKAIFNGGNYQDFSNYTVVKDSAVVDFTELDPVFTASEAATITATNKTNWTAGYDNTVTNVAVTGDETKTITLTQQDGGTLTANFTDNAGTGSIDETNLVHKSGAETITGFKAFDTIPQYSNTGDSTPDAGYFAINYTGLGYTFENADTHNLRLDFKSFTGDHYAEFQDKNYVVAGLDDVDDAKKNYEGIADFNPAEDTIDSDIQLIRVTATGAITMPTPAGSTYRVIHIVCTVTGVTITTFVDKDNNNVTALTQGESYTLWSNGTNWYQIN
ncbi:hypothetical protein SAMN05216480_12315 [Pustulibacterium marinum]|uniref:Uncharacterized protein n=1 Tax=Pustulibacterium marinum TaxID=1224947 RepID=A0A1I7IW29_9FLAO|nr:hypothetical protein [Pustulibacterium marinum]SFU77092.1 hypothetical protein SAMN05216480_12315 [Pustulibacterium marinum]